VQYKGDKAKVVWMPSNLKVLMSNMIPFIEVELTIIEVIAGLSVPLPLHSKKIFFYKCNVPKEVEIQVSDST
jgi:hypothetical protein